MEQFCTILGYAVLFGFVLAAIFFGSFALVAWATNKAMREKEQQRKQEPIDNIPIGFIYDSRGSIDKQAELLKRDIARYHKGK